jgi:hypothetical protein
MVQVSDARARRNVAVLVAAQAILGAQMPMIFTIGGLAGQSLAPNPCWATLPISMIVLGSMLSATPLSALMQRFGRRAGFVVGSAGGAAGAAIGAWGLATGSFVTFLAGSLLTGIYMSAQGFYRFAAADTASEAFRPKAISYVMAGGLLSAIVGPQLVKVTADAMVVPFLGTYLAVIAVNVVGVFLFLGLDIPTPPAPVAGRAEGAEPVGASDDAANRGRRDLRDGELRADEPRDDLDAARRGGLRLRQGRGGRHRVGPCARHVRAVVLHRAPDRALRRGEDRGDGARDPRRGGRGGDRGGGARELLHRADPSRDRLELRIHRGDGDARRVPCARGAGPGAGDERHDRLRLRDAGVLRLGRTDELLGRHAGGGVDGGEPVHAAVPGARGRVR